MTSNWEIVKAEDFCFTVTDGTHDSPKAKENGHYLITSKHLAPYNIDFSSAKKISEEDYQKVIKRSPVEQWDILFSMIGTIGITYLEKNIDIDYACKNMGIFKFNGDKDKAYWLYYYLQTPQAKEYILGHLRGTTQQYLPLGSLRDFPIQVPSAEIRNNITLILRSLDDRIAVNTAINENLLEQLHLLYLRIFCDSAMDTPLGDVVATTSGGTPSRKHDEYYSDSSICWVKSKELLGNYIHETEEHINDLAVKKSSAKLLPEHSVLIAMYGATVGAYGVISKPMTCNQAVCALLCNQDYPYTYLFQIAYESQQKLINLAVGSAQQNISQVLIKQLNLHSDLDIIQKFHNLAFPIHKEIESLQAENIRLSTLQYNLLPKLMNGAIDVSKVKI